MADNVTYVMMYVRDGDGREQSHLLGELREVYRTPVSIGRDPDCDVVLDHPGVPPRAAEFSAGSNHRFVRWANAEMRERIDGHPVRIGAFEIRLAEIIEPGRLALPPAGLPVRFGPRGLGAVLATDIPEDPRTVEARRIADALRAAGGHVRRLDAASAAWCEERLAAHFAALSRVTAPLPPLLPTRIEYTGSLDDAAARWTREWALAEARPFHYVTWSHVHRLGRWWSDLEHVRAQDVHYAGWYAYPTGELLLARLRYTTGAILTAHLATLDDDVSPARPLAGLLARGVYPFALPDSAMLLYLASAEEPVRHSSRPMERDFVDALADDDRAHLVYGDYLEQRGELARAAAIRARSGPTLGGRINDAFGDARALFLPGARVPPAPRDLVPDATVPDARLEIEGHAYPLDSRTGLAWADGRLALVPEPGTAEVLLTQAGGALWLSLGRDHASAALNHRHLFDRTRQPLFDGDVITLRDRSAIVRL